MIGYQFYGFIVLFLFMWVCGAVITLQSVVEWYKEDKNAK